MHLYIFIFLFLLRVCLQRLRVADSPAGSMSSKGSSSGGTTLSRRNYRLASDMDKPKSTGNAFHLHATSSYFCKTNHQFSQISVIVNMYVLLLMHLFNYPCQQCVVNDKCNIGTNNMDGASAKCSHCFPFSTSCSKMDVISSFVSCNTFAKSSMYFLFHVTL